MNGFHAKHIFFTNIGENLQNTWFNLNGTEPTFQKRNVLHEWICIFSARILFPTPKLRKTHFKKKKYSISVFHAKRIFQQEMVKIW